MKKLEEWEKHVLKSGEDLNMVAYCGEKISPYEFHLLDIIHAKGCIEDNARIQPCPKCWEVINNEKDNL